MIIACPLDTSGSWAIIYFILEYLFSLCEITALDFCFASFCRGNYGNIIDVSCFEIIHSACQKTIYGNTAYISEKTSRKIKAPD